jgi:hypothetical protein
VGLKCTIPPRHIIQLKTPAIPLTLIKVGKKFVVLDIFLWDINRDPDNAPEAHSRVSNINFDI